MGEVEFLRVDWIQVRFEVGVVFYGGVLRARLNIVPSRGRRRDLPPRSYCAGMTSNCRSLSSGLDTNHETREFRCLEQSPGKVSDRLCDVTEPAGSL